MLVSSAVNNVENIAPDVVLTVLYMENIAPSLSVPLF